MSKDVSLCRRNFIRWDALYDTHHLDIVSKGWLLHFTHAVHNQQVFNFITDSQHSLNYKSVKKLKICIVKIPFCS